MTCCTSTPTLAGASSALRLILAVTGSSAETFVSVR
jgi:hypothetical protein